MILTSIRAADERSSVLAVLLAVKVCFCGERFYKRSIAYLGILSLVYIVVERMSLINDKCEKVTSIVFGWYLIVVVARCTRWWCPWSCRLRQSNFCFTSNINPANKTKCQWPPSSRNTNNSVGSATRIQHPSVSQRPHIRPSSEQHHTFDIGTSTPSPASITALMEEDEDDAAADLPMTMAASVVLENLPKDAHSALQWAGELENKDGTLKDKGNALLLRDSLALKISR